MIRRLKLASQPFVGIFLSSVKPDNISNKSRKKQQSPNKFQLLAICN
jgi:hypothetical protein